MKYCVSCGSPIDDEARFCTICGAKAEFAEGQPSEKANSNENQSNPQNNVREKIEDAVNNFTNTPNTSAQYTTEDVEKNRFMALLSYFGLFVLIPIFAAKDSPFARYHANQGLLLLIFQILGSICGGIPVVGAVIAVAANILGLFFFALGIVNSIKGEAKELPLIGKFRILK